MKYWNMNPYLKRIDLILDSWILYRDEEEWRIIREEIKMAEVEGKW